MKRFWIRVPGDAYVKAFAPGYTTVVLTPNSQDAKLYRTETGAQFCISRFEEEDSTLASQMTIEPVTKELLPAPKPKQDDALKGATKGPWFATIALTHGEQEEPILGLDMARALAAKAGVKVVGPDASGEPGEWEVLVDGGVDRKLVCHGYWRKQMDDATIEIQAGGTE